MMHLRAGRLRGRLSAVLLALILVTTGAAGARQSGTPHVRDITAAIAGAPDTEERGQAIVSHLETFGVQYRLEDFLARQKPGTNIVATVPGKGSKTLLLGAHYDRVEQGQGAVDNAASCVVLLELLQSLAARPLSNYTVTALFADQEELGLLGSKTFIETIQRGGGRLPDLAINLDIFAYGDTLWVTGSSEQSRLVRAIRQAAEPARFPVRFTSQYPPSDHQSFIAAGIDTLSAALIDGNEIDSVIQAFSAKGPAALPNPIPRILSLIHSVNDTTDKVRPQDIEKAIPVLEGAIRLIDREG